jgi:hypothetical protein
MSVLLYATENSNVRIPIEEAVGWTAVDEAVGVLTVTRMTFFPEVPGEVILPDAPSHLILTGVLAGLPLVLVYTDIELGHPRYTDTGDMGTANAIYEKSSNPHYWELALLPPLGGGGGWTGESGSMLGVCYGVLFSDPESTVTVTGHTPAPIKVQPTGLPSAPTAPTKVQA